MDSKFFSFIKPYLAIIDNGSIYRKPFSWLYGVIAIGNLIFPFYILYMAIDSRLFRYADAKYIVFFILIWLVIVFVSWISFQIWFDRMSRVTSTSSVGDEFVATPVFSHFIQTLGEWLGTWIAVVGFAVALLGTVFLGDDSLNLSQLGVPFVSTGIVFVILMPIYGFLIIVSARFMAEQFRALSSIANNTRRS